MPFVGRDAQGNITAISERRGKATTEEIAANDREVIEFLARPDRDEEAERLAMTRLELMESDLGMARLIEDMVEGLVANGTLMLTDLPEAAREKIMQRRDLRERMRSISSLIDDDIL